MLHTKSELLVEEQTESVNDRIGDDKVRLNTLLSPQTDESIVTGSM